MSREFWLGVRQAVCLFLDVLERELICRGWWNKPLSSELRRESKNRTRE